MDCSPPGLSVHGFSRQGCWNGLPCPTPGDLPDPGNEPVFLISPTLADGFFTTSATWEINYTSKKRKTKLWIYVFNLPIPPNFNEMTKKFCFNLGNTIWAVAPWESGALSSSPSSESSLCMLESCRAQPDLFSTDTLQQKPWSVGLCMWCIYCPRWVSCLPGLSFLPSFWPSSFPLFT